MLKIIPRLWFALCVVLSAVGICSGEPSTTTTSSGPSTGSLAIFPDGSVPDGVTSIICVVKGGKICAKEGSSFNEPILFKDLPVGEVTVVIVPWFGFSEKCISGNYKCIIEAGKRATLRIKVDPQPTSHLKLRIYTAGGSAVSNTVVWFEDVTVPGLSMRRLLDTDKNGELAVKVCNGQKYRASLFKSGISEAIPYRSDVIEIAKARESVDWVLREPATVKIRFFQRDDKGKLIVAADLKSVRVTSGEGYAVDVHNGEIELAKNGAAIAGAKKMLIEIIGMPGAGEMELDKGEIAIDDKDKQICDLVIVPARVSKISFESPTKAAMAYLVGKGGSYYGGVRNGGWTKLPFGDYEVYYVAGGFMIEKQALKVNDRVGHVIKCVLKPATSVAGRILAPDGSPIKDSVIVVEYEDLPFLVPFVAGTSDAKGQYTMLLDDAYPAIVTATSVFGGRALRVAVDRRDALKEIQFSKACIVRGSIAVPAAISSNENAQKIMWCDGSMMKVRLSESDIKNGRFKAALQPGKYDVLLFIAGDAVRVETIEVKPSDAEIKMKQIIVTEKLWKTREAVKPRAR